MPVVVADRIVELDEGRVRGAGGEGRRRGHRAVLDRLDRIVRRIKADDFHVFQSCTVERLHRTERHLIVMSEYGDDVFIVLQDILHDRQSLGPVKVSRLFGHDVKFSVNRFVESLTTVTCC